MWKLKQIFDGEYGCEERQPGEKEKCLVILVNEEGEEKTFEANEDWIAAIEKLSANPLMKIIISKPMAKDCQYKKIVVEKKGDGYQAAKYTEKQVFHDNFGAEDLQGYLMEAIHDTFLQVNAWDEKREYSLLISKKGAVTLRAKASKEAPDTVTEHNRKKNYILDEGQVIPPLVDMGIFTGEGKVVKSMYDKFRQINRFIEIGAVGGGGIGNLAIMYGYNRYQTGVLLVTVVALVIIVQVGQWIGDKIALKLTRK